mgnify:CR=1 FL=1
MDKDELISDIEIVLEKELEDLKYRDTWSLKIENEDRFIEYPNSKILTNLFLMTDSNLLFKKAYIQYLQEKLETSQEKTISLLMGETNSYSGISQLCFYTLSKLGFIDEAISSLERRTENCGLIILILDAIFWENPLFFPKDALDKLLIYLKNIDVEGYPAYKAKERVIKLIIESRVNYLVNKIDKINFEINVDKKKLIEKIKYLEFDESYTYLLDKIDDYLISNNSDLINSGMISNLRSFLEQLFKDVAKKIEFYDKDKIPSEADSPMANIRIYLKRKLNLTDDENKFISKFISILNSEGGHSFTSEKEYFRLAKNIAIEISLFIMTKLEKKYTN